MPPTRSKSRETMTPRRRTRGSAVSEMEEVPLTPGWTTGNADLFKMPSSPSPVRSRPVTRRTSIYRAAAATKTTTNIPKRAGRASLAGVKENPVPVTIRRSSTKVSPGKKLKSPDNPPKRRTGRKQSKSPVKAAVKAQVETKATRRNTIAGTKRNTLKPIEEQAGTVQSKDRAFENKDGKVVKRRKVFQEAPAAPSLLAKSTPSVVKKVPKSASPAPKMSSPVEPKKSAVAKKEVAKENFTKIVSPKEKKSKIPTPKQNSQNKVSKSPLVKISTPVIRGSAKKILLKSASRKTPRVIEVLRVEIQSPGVKKVTPGKRPMSVKKLNAKSAQKSTAKKAAAKSPSLVETSPESPVSFKTPRAMSPKKTASVKKSESDSKLLSSGVEQVTPTIATEPKSLDSELAEVAATPKVTFKEESLDTPHEGLSVKTRGRTRKRLAKTPLPHPLKAKIATPSKEQEAGDGTDTEKMNISTEQITTQENISINEGRKESQVWSWCAIL